MAEGVFYDLDVVDKSLVGEIVTLTLFVKGADKRPADIELNQLRAYLWTDDKTRGEMQLEGYRKRVDVGTYTFEWAPHICGVYRLKLQRENKRLFANADIKISIEDDVPVETRQFEFEIGGAGTRSARCNRPVTLDLTVTSKGVKTDVKMNDLKVKFTGNGKQNFAEIGRKGVGDYAVTFTAPTPGFYAVTVIYETYKPVKTKVIFHEPTIPRNTVLDLPANALVCNKPAGFTISSRDIHGQAVTVGGDPWLVDANGPGNLQNLKIEDHQTGTYTVTFVLPKPGTYTINVTLDGTPAKKSPFKVIGT